MLWPHVNFISLHYAYILTFGILALAILYPAGNLAAIDAYFFGVSSSTESGLNTVDVKDLKIYQQIFIYIVPIVTNLGFINIFVVVVRLHWFRKRFKNIAKEAEQSRKDHAATTALEAEPSKQTEDNKSVALLEEAPTHATTTATAPAPANDALRISFAPDPRRAQDEKRDDDIERTLRDDTIPIPSRSKTLTTDTVSRRRMSGVSLDHAVSSVFVLGDSKKHRNGPEPHELAVLSREELGGIEYRALKVLLKVTTAYFFGLHLFGVICLLPWIHTADEQYKSVLAGNGINKTWWAFYSSQTMVNNLGFTLTPDSMISFRAATWPMLVMSFLAYAGNTFYPCFLRLFIWSLHKLSPKGSSVREPLQFLLDHPRRCYTLLFSGAATWVLATVLIVLNFIDIVLIITLDLDNPEVTALPVGPRILAAIFQAASARHTGTATFNLANVNPAVQFSLLVMMYISIYPIAISIRMSGDGGYESRPVGVYGAEEDVNEAGRSQTYIVTHMRNQLSFDLWYIFLGVFCICCAESRRIMDREDYAFSVFSIFFEVVSAYGNVGLSLGHPDNLTSLSGHFSVFSKLVVCAMMIRGRHRGMPYALDRAITIPSDRLADTALEKAHAKDVEAWNEKRDLREAGGWGWAMSKSHTR